jgi:hypothetical protein
MRLFLISLSLILTACTYNDMRKLFTDRPDAYTKFSGNFHYTKSQVEAAQNKTGIEIKRPIYTTKNKKQMYYVGGSIYHNHDVFKRVSFVNGFGQAGIEF